MIYKHAQWPAEAKSEAGYTPILPRVGGWVGLGGIPSNGHRSQY